MVWVRLNAQGASHEDQVFVEIDPAKAHNAVARLVRKLSSCHVKLYFCHEAGPTGHGLYRQILPHNGAKTTVLWAIKRP
jgi:transposase